MAGFPLDIASPVRAYIQSHYSDLEVKDSAEDLAEIQRLREEVVASKLALEDQRSLLAKYYRALNAIESRFPISKVGSPFTQRPSSARVEVPQPTRVPVAAYAGQGAHP